ncbi:hypothetical protein M5K25_024809 [Dendrobium thyrsiflorum]|uniref:3-beta hydroxysteroid dehydrogenase/isomerase domain-containing protein n=1 Tax=Dendrobium thyrsiflorum TaxID=117978 RepID=A0ABD0U372_DENTH
MSESCSMTLTCVEEVDRIHQGCRTYPRLCVRALLNDVNLCGRGRENPGCRTYLSGRGRIESPWDRLSLIGMGRMPHVSLIKGSEKNAHLRKMDKAAENLQLFKADLLDYNAIEAAIFGCEGVFHVASPVILSGISNPEVELIRPALLGTRNIFKACSKTNIKRVVVVSSNAAIAINPDWPHGTIMDERCWLDEDFCRESELERGASIQLANAIIETENARVIIQFGSLDFSVITVRAVVVSTHRINSKGPIKRPYFTESATRLTHLPASRATNISESSRRRIFVFERLSQPEAPATKRVIVGGKISVFTSNATSLLTGLSAPGKYDAKAFSYRGSTIRQRKKNAEL